jgi:diguanylate cyclase (GGDEF)-like protein
MVSADILQFPHTHAMHPMEAPDSTASHLPSLDETLLCNRLHRFLDVQSLLEQFVQETRQTLAITSLRFRLPDSNETIEIGTSRKVRSVRTHLRCGADFLGEIEFQSAAATHVPLPRALAPLIAPLQNALCHHQLRQLSHTDPMTGLGNRAALQNALSNECARSQRFEYPLALLVIDIDHFKHFNDTFGHSAGDLVLRMVASQIKDCLRPYDQAFRFGGEEFVVLLSQTPLGKATRIADRIRRRISVQCKIESKAARKITVSIGASELREEEAVQELFDRADQALYRAKNLGRNRVIAA